jgi:hypothetical protein
LDRALDRALDPELVPSRGDGIEQPIRPSPFRFMWACLECTARLFPCTAGLSVHRSDLGGTDVRGTDVRGTDLGTVVVGGNAVAAPAGFVTRWDWQADEWRPSRVLTELPTPASPVPRSSALTPRITRQTIVAIGGAPCRSVPRKPLGCPYLRRPQTPSFPILSQHRSAGFRMLAPRANTRRFRAGYAHPAANPPNSARSWSWSRSSGASAWCRRGRAGFPARHCHACDRRAPRPARSSVLQLVHRRSSLALAVAHVSCFLPGH